MRTHVTRQSRPNYIDFRNNNNWQSHDGSLDNMAREAHRASGEAPAGRAPIVRRGAALLALSNGDLCCRRVRLGADAVFCCQFASYNSISKCWWQQGVGMFSRISGAECGRPGVHYCTLDSWVSAPGERLAGRPFKLFFPNLLTTFALLIPSVFYRGIEL